MKLLAYLIFLIILVINTSGMGIVDLLTGGGCGLNSQVSGGVVVSHLPIGTLPPITNNITCFFTMQAIKFRQKIRIVFQHFALTPTDCTISYLDIYNGSTDSDPLIRRICPTDNVVGMEFTSTRFYMTLKLQVSRNGSVAPTANFTAFYLGFTDNRSPCVDPSLEFACGNGRCVYRDLECDGMDSCGDNTDESPNPPTNCNFTTTTSSGTTTLPASTTTLPAGPTAATPVMPASTTTAPPMSTIPPATTAPTTTTTTPIVAVNVPDKVFPDLTALYIILTLAFAVFGAYLVYALLSFQCFKTLMLSCLHKCCLMIVRRRKLELDDDKKSMGKSGKVSPELFNGSMILENLSTVSIKSSNDLVNGCTR